MKIHIPFICPSIDHNDTFYHKNYRILFWHFQLLEELRKRGFWLVFAFNPYQWKLFKHYCRFKNAKWEWYKNDSHKI